MENTKREWTKEELVEAFDNFQAAADYVLDNWQNWYEIIGVANKSLSDINHAVELKEQPKTLKEKAEIYDKMKGLLKERRRCKDLREVFKDSSWQLREHISVLHAIKKVRGLSEGQKDRVYSPRHLDELFD